MPPSRGCYTCIARKIKCDEGTPSCQKCIKFGKACPGYRNCSDLVIRDMTGLAKKKVQSRVQKVLTARDQAVTEIFAPREPSSYDFLPPYSDISEPSVYPYDVKFSYDLFAQLTIQQLTTPDWREDVVDQFFDDYVLDSDAVPDTTNVFPGLYRSPDAAFCLKDAIRAAALVSQANQLGLEWMVEEAREAYGRALASLGRALSDPVEALKDTTLGATYCISMYEAIAGHRPIQGIADYHHHRGRLQLFRLRGAHQINSTVGRRLWNVLHEHAIMKCIMWHEKPLEDANAWVARFGKKRVPVLLMQLNCRTAQWCAEAQILFDTGSHNKEWERALLDVVKDANLIDREYQNIIDHYSSSEFTRHRTFFAPPGLSLPAGQMVRTYYDIWAGYIWTGARAKRVHLHEVLLHCFDILDSHHSEAESLSSRLERLNLRDESRVQSKLIIEEMVSDICAAVPFMLGDVDAKGKHVLGVRRMPLGGYVMMWPLNVARASVEQGSEREIWMVDRLDFINAKMGIRLAGMAAKRRKKVPWDLKSDGS